MFMKRDGPEVFFKGFALVRPEGPVNLGLGR